jgi:hypothetical protein
MTSVCHDSLTRARSQRSSSVSSAGTSPEPAINGLVDRPCPRSDPARAGGGLSGVARVLGAALLAVGLSACGGSGQEQILVAGDDCSYQGAMTLDEGEITAAMHLTSLGHNEMSIVRLDEERTYPELVTYLEQAADPITDRPPWISEVLHLELLHEAGEREGESGTFTATEGTYAVICIDQWGSAGPTAQAIAEITVTAP